MKQIISDDGINQVVFNGVLYLAKNRNVSSQYLGSGRTAQDAINNMEDSIQVINKNRKLEKVKECKNNNINKFNTTYIEAEQELIKCYLAVLKRDNKINEVEQAEILKAVSNIVETALKED